MKKLKTFMVEQECGIIALCHHHVEAETEEEALEIFNSMLMDEYEGEQLDISWPDLPNEDLDAWMWHHDGLEPEPVITEYEAYWKKKRGNNE